MGSKLSFFSKVAAVCGILLTIIAFTFITLSIYYSLWFNFTENWLSELAGAAG